jgi:hypothetical protein
VLVILRRPRKSQFVNQRIYSRPRVLALAV